MGEDTLCSWCGKETLVDSDSVCLECGADVGYSPIDEEESAREGLAFRFVLKVLDGRLGLPEDKVTGVENVLGACDVFFPGVDSFPTPNSSSFAYLMMELDRLEAEFLKDFIEVKILLIDKESLNEQS